MATGWMRTAPCSELERRKALSELAPFMAVASLSDLLNAVERLSVSCAMRRDMDARQAGLWAGQVARALQEYPADCALEALKDWPKTENGKWWPTEAEVREQAQMRANFRAWLQRRLEEWEPPVVREKIDTGPKQGAPSAQFLYEIQCRPVNSIYCAERGYHTVEKMHLARATWGDDWVSLESLDYRFVVEAYAELAEQCGVDLRKNNQSKAQLDAAKRNDFKGALADIAKGTPA